MLTVVNVCPAPPNSVNGHYISWSSSSGNSAAVGTTLTLTCDAGYYSSSESANIPLTCENTADGDDAEWTPIPVSHCGKDFACRCIRINYCFSFFEITN